MELVAKSCAYYCQRSRHKLQEYDLQPFFRALPSISHRLPILLLEVSFHQ
eukprot:07078.XXX_388820_388969_1 [CDS] Oithona nana genome sequencing.